MVDQIEIGNGKDDNTLEVTLRGEPTQIVNALVNGLTHESLVQLKEALDAEMLERALPHEDAETGSARTE